MKTKNLKRNISFNEKAIKDLERIYKYIELNSYSTFVASRFINDNEIEILRIVSSKMDQTKVL